MQYWARGKSCIHPQCFLRSRSAAGKNMTHFGFYTIKVATRSDYASAIFKNAPVQSNVLLLNFECKQMCLLEMKEPLLQPALEPSLTQTAFFKTLGLFMDWWEALIRYTALCKTRWSMHACGTVSAIPISKITSCRQFKGGKPGRCYKLAQDVKSNKIHERIAVFSLRASKSSPTRQGCLL